MFTKNVKGEDENSDGAYPTITNQGFIKQTVLEVIGKYSPELILSFSNIFYRFMYYNHHQAAPVSQLGQLLQNGTTTGRPTVRQSLWA